MTTTALCISIVPQLPPTVLLVDQYYDPLFGEPPLSGYTDAMNAAGIGFDVWDVAQRGSIPSLTNLLAYRAVFWRVGEFSGWSATRLSGNQQLSGRRWRAVCGVNGFADTERRGGRHELQPVGAGRCNSSPRTRRCRKSLGTGDAVGEGMDVALDYTVYEESLAGLAATSQTP